jgi:predicted esterase
VAVLALASPGRAKEKDHDETSATWCAPDVETLANDVCARVPAKQAAGPRTLVVFLHGVIQPGTTWQWQQQRGAALFAEKYGFTVIAPRGVRGIGPKGMEDWFTWPTAVAEQDKTEAALFKQWNDARATLEKRAGKPFERVWIFGFSNGGYYATSLALRGRLPVDGYAVFAGGSGAKYLKNAGAATKRRAPVFVGWGEKDKAHGDQVKLAKLLKALKWPSTSKGSKTAGHVVLDGHVAEAVKFLSRTKVADAVR